MKTLNWPRLLAWCIYWIYDSLSFCLWSGTNSKYYDMRFKPGQKVVCIKRDVWMSRRHRKPAIGPKFNEIVTVAGPGQEPGCVFIVEYPTNGFSNSSTYLEKWFEPLVSDDVLESELESIFEVVKQ